jgi:methyl-accepting chemotaxis protein
MRRLQAEQEEVKHKAEEEKRQALANLATDFERQVRGIVETVSSAATQLQSTARAMSSTADGTRAQTLAVASGADQALDIGLHRQLHDRLGHAAQEVAITGFGRQLSQG